MFNKTVLAAIALLIINGCTTKEDYLLQKRSLAMGQGASPAYADGFQDACEGIYDMTFKKDIKRAETDKRYAQGWQDGQDYCEKEQAQTRYYYNQSVYMPYYHGYYY